MGTNGEMENTPLLLAAPKIKTVIGLGEALKGLIHSLERADCHYDEPFAQSIFHLLVMEAMSYTESWSDQHYVEQAVSMLVDVSGLHEEVAMEFCRDCSTLIYAILTMHMPLFGSKAMDGQTTYKILPNNVDILVEFPAGVIHVK